MDFTLLVEPNGQVRFLHDDELISVRRRLGPARINRVSVVEPDEQGQWWADLAVVCGPRLGPFARRAGALAAEAAWLAEHGLPCPDQNS